MSGPIASLTGPMRVWRPLCLEIEGPADAVDAETFRDFAVGAYFEHEQSDLRVSLRGALAPAAGGPRFWRIWFTPPREGAWRYRIWFKTGVDAALSDTGRAAPSDGVLSCPRELATLASGSPADETTGRFWIARSDANARGDRSLDLTRVGPAQLTSPAPGPQRRHGGDRPELGALTIADGPTRRPLRFAPEPLALLARPPTETPIAAADAFAAAQAALAEDARATAVAVAPLVFAAEPSSDRGDGLAPDAADAPSEPLAHPWAEWAGAPQAPDDGAAIDAMLAKSARSFAPDRLDQWADAIQRLAASGVAVFVALDAAAPPGSPALARWRRPERAADRRLFLREMVARFGHLNGVVWVGPADAEERALARRLDGHDRPVVAAEDLARAGGLVWTGAAPALAEPELTDSRAPETDELRSSGPTPLFAPTGASPSPSEQMRLADMDAPDAELGRGQQPAFAAMSETDPVGDEDAPTAAAPTAARAARPRRWSILSRLREGVSLRRADNDAGAEPVEEALVLGADGPRMADGDHMVDGGQPLAARTPAQTPETPSRGSPVAGHALVVAAPRRRWTPNRADDAGVPEPGAERREEAGPRGDGAANQQSAPGDAQETQAAAPKRRFRPGAIAAARRREAAAPPPRGEGGKPTLSLVGASGAARIDLRLYLLAGEERGRRVSAHPQLIGQAAPRAVEIDGFGALDVDALATPNAAIIARLDGDDREQAAVIRLSIGAASAPEAWFDVELPVDAPVLFDGFERAVDGVLARVSAADGPALAMFRVYGADAAGRSGPPLRTWRYMLARPDPSKASIDRPAPPAAEPWRTETRRPQARRAEPQPAQAWTQDPPPREAARAEARRIALPAPRRAAPIAPQRPARAAPKRPIEAPPPAIAPSRALQEVVGRARPPALLDERPAGLVRALSQVSSARAERLRKRRESGLELISLDVLDSATKARIAALSSETALELDADRAEDLALRAVFGGPEVDRARHVRVRLTMLDRRPDGDRRRNRRVVYQATGAAVSEADGVVARFDDFRPPRGRAALWLEALDSGGAPLLQLRLTVTDRA